MFKALIDGIKNFFADDPEDLGPEELVALVADTEANEARRKEGAECLSELSDTISEMPASEAVKIAVSNRCFSKLNELLASPGQPPWVYLGCVNGMNEIINVSRMDMERPVLEAGIDALIGRAGQGYPDDVRVAASMALSSFDDYVSEAHTQRAIEAVLSNVRQASGEVQSYSLHSLGSFDSELTAHLWSEAAGYLDHADPKVRASACSVLWMIGNDNPDAAVVDKLIAVMQNDRNTETRCDATNALGHLGKGHPGAVEALTAALRDHELRHWAIFALYEFEGEAASAVSELVRHLDDDEHQDGVVMALQAIGTEEARKALRDAGHDEEG